MAARQILWVDDDLDDLDMFAQALRDQDAGMLLVAARNGLEALSYLEEAGRTGQWPALVVLDMNMPLMGGRETLVRIKTREDLCHLPTVVFTTSSNPLDAAFCKKYGAPIRTKPKTIHELRTIIRAFIRLSRRC